MNFLVCKLCGRPADDESHVSLGYKPTAAVLDVENMRNRSRGWLCGDCVREVAELPAAPLLVEAVKLTCDPDPDKPTLPSEAVLEAIGDILETGCHEVLGINGLFADFLVKSADELHPLHELVKAAGACVCPKEKAGR